jgi:hypothetical protein
MTASGARHGDLRVARVQCRVQERVSTRGADRQGGCAEERDVGRASRWSGGLNRSGGFDALTVFHLSARRWQVRLGAGACGSGAAARAASRSWTRWSFDVWQGSQALGPDSWFLEEPSEHSTRTTTEESLVDGKGWDGYTVQGWASRLQGDATSRSVRCGGYGSWNVVSLQNAVPAPAGRPGRSSRPQFASSARHLRAPGRSGGSRSGHTRPDGREVNRCAP